MSLLGLAVGYLVMAAVLIALLLFGESPLMRGTPIAWGHWLLTKGVWDALECCMVRLCGERSRQWVERVLVCCCDRPNIILQLSYVALVIVGFWMYATNLFVLLPNAWASKLHIWTGSLSVVLAAAAFVAACRSDPGIITRSTLAAHRALYPCDGQVWPEKECQTCEWARPARSKHCRVCGHCVARHDHHCGWINNCVGLGNHRMFLLFLISNLGMTIYGTLLGGIILLGTADRAGVLRRRVMDYRTNSVATIYLPPARLFDWLVHWVPLGVAVTIFMAVATLMLLGFLAYQLYLICSGRTQYEVLRWRDLYSTKLHTAERDLTAARQAAEQKLATAEQEAEQELAAARQAAGQDVIAAGQGAAKGTTGAARCAQDGVRGHFGLARRGAGPAQCVGGLEQQGGKQGVGHEPGGIGDQAVSTRGQAGQGGPGAVQRHGGRGGLSPPQSRGNQVGVQGRTRGSEQMQAGVQHRPASAPDTDSAKQRGAIPPLQPDVAVEQRRAADLVSMPGNLYHHGWRWNLSDVLFPGHALARALPSASPAAAGGRSGPRKEKGHHKQSR